MGRIFFLFKLLLGTLLTLALACFLLWLTLYSWFATFLPNHYSLRGSANIILQSGVFVCSSIQFFHGGRWVKEKGLEERSSWPEAPSKVLQDCIHTIGINLLNGLPESSGELPDGLVIPLEDGLEPADVSLLSNGAQILSDECGP